MYKKKPYKPPVKGRKRTRKDSGLELLIRREKVVDLRLKKKSLYEIAKILKVSHTTIKKDLDSVREQSKERNSAFWEEYIEECMHELNHLVKTNWQEWELSKVKVLRDKEGNEIGKEEKVGNPIYLQEVHSLVQTKLKLAGSLKSDTIINNDNRTQVAINFADLYQRPVIVDPAEEAIKLLEAKSEPLEESVEAILERLNKETLKESIDVEAFGSVKSDELLE